MFAVDRSKKKRYSQQTANARWEGEGGSQEDAPESGDTSDSEHSDAGESKRFDQAAED